jgi:hypothetical protein
MADILPFEKVNSSEVKKLGLCGHGHHQWKVRKNTQFDTKRGKLVSRFQCERCGKTRVKRT